MAGPEARQLAHEAERITRNPGRYALVAKSLTHWTGSLAWVLVVIGAFVTWLALGWAVGFPRWWELAVTVGLPFLTLLVLALVQHTQNHDSNAIELKLDEIICTLDGASDAMLRVEEASEDDLRRLQEHYGSRAR